MLTTDGAVTPAAAAPVDDDEAPVVGGAPDFEEEEQAKAVTATITPKATTARVRRMVKWTPWWGWFRSMEDRTAVGADGLPGHVGSGGAAQPRDERPDVGGSAEASGRNGPQVGVSDLAGAGPAQADLGGPLSEDHVGLGRA